ncbi:alpha/beta fold hydrolase [Brucella sp. IR073]|uniref:alpha/beta fold hydrolase n=1 Tax=unclassified Brucella TaxID=2632610 RepID=UPI003B986C3F
MTDYLFESDINRAPAGTRSGMLEMRDGKVLRYSVTPGVGVSPRGTVIILHGRNEYIEKYFETMADLAAGGLTVATFDWRGQGGSSRLLRDPLRGHVNNFDDYVLDLGEVMHDLILPDCPPPYYILAHSTGGLIALLAAPALAGHIRRMVLTAPFLGLPGSRLAIGGIRLATRTAGLVGLGGYYANGRRGEAQPFADNPLTSDPRRFLRNAEIIRDHPQLGLGGPTARWVSSALRAMDQVHDHHFMSNFSIPTLIVAAGADKVVSTLTTERYAARLRNGALLVIDGARHEILQEADFFREQLLAAFDAFIPGSDFLEIDQPAFRSA